MVMRIGGLASGINTDEIITKLMNAERMPLDRMEQDRTLLEWQRDGYREIYQKLYEMDTDPDLMLNMKMQSTYNTKSVTSSNESAVTATATSSSSNGSYSIQVTELAAAETHMSSSAIAITDPNAALDAYAGTYQIKVYNEETSAFDTHDVVIENGDTLDDVLTKINDADLNVRAYYDNTANKVIVESSRTGKYNPAGNDVEFQGAFFTDVLKLDGTAEVQGKDAQFQYNGMSFTSKTNSYTLNGVTFNFHNTTTQNVNLTVNNDVDAAFDSIMKFVDKYNEIVDIINKSQTEERYRDYKPLTDAQRKEMDEKEIELWEEKAKSGILRGETILTDGLFDIRQSWYKEVATGGEYTTLTQVGVSTTSNYMNGGKLVVDEKKLKEALRENPDDVYKLFSNNTTDKNDPARGLINRVEDSVESTIKRIEERAGRTTSTLDNYTLGKRIKDLDTRISDFEDRLVRVENRYWRQFNAMEQAISRLNNQSAQLLSQFGG